MWTTIRTLGSFYLMQMAGEEERNFRVPYYHKILAKGVDLKAIDKILEERPVNLSKLQSYVLKFGLTSNRRVIAWKSLLGKFLFILMCILFFSFPSFPSFSLFLTFASYLFFLFRGFRSYWTRRSDYRECPQRNMYNSGISFKHSSHDKWSHQNQY